MNGLSLDCSIKIVAYGHHRIPLLFILKFMLCGKYDGYWDILFDDIFRAFTPTSWLGRVPFCFYQNDSLQFHFMTISGC